MNYDSQLEEELAHAHFKYTTNKQRKQIMNSELDCYWSIDKNYTTPACWL